VAAYDSDRRPATTAVVVANRQVGPERSMDLVEERAPEGFVNIEDVISQEELEAIARTYKRIAGFDPEVLNNRPSLSVR
jgi:5-methylphenazine-1-carboxylate 1-monooxygenase